MRMRLQCVRITSVINRVVDISSRQLWRVFFFKKNRKNHRSLNNFITTRTTPCHGQRRRQFDFVTCLISWILSPKYTWPYHVGRKIRRIEIKTLLPRRCLKQWMTKIGLPAARNKHGFDLFTCLERRKSHTHVMCVYPHTWRLYNLYFRSFLFNHALASVRTARVTHHITVIVYGRTAGIPVSRPRSDTDSFPSRALLRVNTSPWMDVTHICTLFSSATETAGTTLIRRVNVTLPFSSRTHRMLQQYYHYSNAIMTWNKDVIRKVFWKWISCYPCFEWVRYTASINLARTMLTPAVGKWFLR